MENPKKSSIDKKQDVVQEPEAIYMNQTFQKQNIIGFDIEGNSIFEEDYVADIQDALNCLAIGKLETYSSQEVKRKILG
ncbi:MAG TPA: hypothetical protein DCM02_04880 [Flavobacterium sp.]|nr:hypothetical protein [Flavobacterium sp.]HAT77384.1 hypothetical protein [Flavobacterium sp.]HAT81258.1 hypothetical protein [Flavobacterium sp.]